MKIKAAVQNSSSGELSLCNIELEEPRADEVLVKIVACGICHTDIMMQHSNGNSPFLLGHEGSGIVEKVGTNITDFSPGDSVVISYTSCGHCPSCAKKRPFQCEKLYDPFFLGYREDRTTSVSLNGTPVPTLIGQGSFAQYTVVHWSSLVKVDSTLDLRVLAPLGCGMMTGAGAVVNYLKPKEGSSILICGLGAVGFGALTAAKQSKCSTIIVIDRISERLELAEEFGETHTINSSNTSDLESEIKKICGALDYGFDSTGSSVLLTAMSQTLKHTAIACGVGDNHLSGFDWQTTDEGFSIPQEMIPQMIQWYKAGAFPIEKLLCFYPFDKINEAMNAIRQGLVIKPVLIM